MKPHLYTILFAINLFHGTSLAADQSCSTITMWTRGAGDYRYATEGIREKESTIRISELKTKSRKLTDSQYGEEKVFKAVSLSDAIAGYPLSPNVDLVLLHFQNKMILPLALSNKNALAKIFIATAIQVDKKWSDEFPKMSRPDPDWRDPRPIQFCGNKMVVSKPFSFKLAEQSVAPKTFTPWRYVDSLVGIEFANTQAYYNQFDVAKSAESREGFQVFKNRCQFCHGAQYVGAGLGWDYAGPIPAHEKRLPPSLFLHVKYEKVEQFRLGTIMPAQSDMQEHEAKVLWRWLKDVTENKLKPYQP